MTDDNIPRVSSSESSDSATTKKRRKRKWDQPAESVVSGLLPYSNMGSLSGTSLPGVATISGVYYSNSVPVTVSSFFPVAQSLPQQHDVAISQKLIQIQDEVIAREIVINDADSNMRYKLTKRHTQEEIQKVTGAIVITRGKYKPPNASLDGEKPLYLHISAGAHLETTAERIKAVDRAAAMVEEMLKHGSLGSGANTLNACVYLGFEADPSLNIAARIRGPNDQYVNHIMNETGATVLLRGHDSGNSESIPGEEGQQPLHLFLSSNNLKSLERAKLLADNLLDTISAELSATRFSSSKVYGAVPPPPQLLAEGQSSVDESNANIRPAAGLAASALGSTASTIPAVTVPTVSIVASQGPVPQMDCSNSGSGQSQATPGFYSHPSFTHGTSYNGYGGIYPQATPLQQVALALRHSTSPVTDFVAPTITTASTSSSEKDKPSSQKRKFKESPVVLKGLVNSNQVFSLTLYEANRLIMELLDINVLHRVVVEVACGAACVKESHTCSLPFYVDPKLLRVAELGKPHELTSDLGAKDDKRLTKGLLPSREEVMPPPPPKFTLSSPGVHSNGPGVPNQSKSESVPETLIKLMEYGEGDEDEDEDDCDDKLCEPMKEILERSSNSSAAAKPFWAV